MARFRRSVIICLIASLGAGALPAATTPPAQPQQSEWSYFGGSKGFTRYSPLDQIHRDNVADLRIAWRRPAVRSELTEAFPDLFPSAYLRSTPIFVDGVLYAQDAHGLVIALDAATGEIVWEQELVEFTQEEADGEPTRGVDYWSSGSGDDRILAVRGEYLYALNTGTGEPYGDFGDDGRVSLRFEDRQPLAGSFSDSSGPIIVGDVVVVSGITAGAGDRGNKREAVPEDARGYDVRTGELLWTFHVVPQEGEFGVETWGNDSWKVAGDMGAWSLMSADEELGYVYVAFSAPTTAWYGGWRPGDNLFSNSLVALDAQTGERVWHFQMIHHGLWDYEPIGPATLGEVTVDGRRVPVVMQPTKHAFLFVFDRRNGEPLWPIEERPVPASTVPGEAASPTQPFPTKPPPFDWQGITEADLIDYTPALNRQARELASQYVTGPLFTPPSVPSDEPGGTKGSLLYPGAWGAGNWNTGAFDPETGVYYAVSNSPYGPGSRNAVKQTDPAATMEYAYEPTAAPTIDGLFISKPPHGRITALDLNRGEQLWMAANGDGQRKHPLLRHLNLPPLGVPNRPAPLLTKTLLFLGEGSNAVMGTLDEEWAWGRVFRAYDKATGDVVWAMELPSGTTAGPMTYMLDGRQYIVVSVGDQNHPPEYVALALP
jgi:quinoprotein glucose dehydrogenase